MLMSKKTVRGFFIGLALAATSALYVTSCAPDIAHAQIVNPSQPATGVPVAGTGITVAGQTVSINYGLGSQTYTGTVNAAALGASSASVSGTVTAGTVSATTVSGTNVSASSTVSAANLSATGGIGSSASITGSTNAGPFHMGSLTFSDTGIWADFTANTNSYTQFILQNQNAGTAASSGFLVANDQGTATTHYGEFGINSSAFTGTGSLNLPGATYLTGTTGDLSIGTTSANAIHFVVNSGATDAMALSSTGALSVGGTAVAGPSGASILGYQLGFTGATQRTQFQKDGDIISALDANADNTGVADATTALANMTGASANGVVANLPSGIYKHGATNYYPEMVVANQHDYATVGTNNQFSNSTLTGTPATGWTLANFTSLNPGVQHTAGTSGTLTQNVTLTPYTMYVFSVTLTTTTQGGIAFNVNGNPVFDAGSYSVIPTGSGVTYTYSFLSSTDNASEPIQLFTDNNWAGTITNFSFYAVQQESQLTYVTVPTDDHSMNIPQGLKIGRFNAGVIGLGDRQTGALYNSSAVWNIGIGPRVNSTNQSGFENTGVGAFALQYNTSPRLVAFGYSALKYNLTGIQDTALGYKALVNNSTGNNNTAGGFWSSFSNTTGNQETSFGYQALYDNQTGNYNTGVGHQAGINEEAGSENSYFGALAGFLNSNANLTYAYNFTTSIGAESKVYGNNGTAVGYLAVVGSDPNSSGTAVANSTAIGANATTNIANTAKVGFGLTAVNLSGQLQSRQIFNSETAGTGTTYTANEFVLSTVLNRSGPTAAFTDTTPTAASIAALIPGVEVGTGYDIYIRNTTTFAETLAANTGVTLAGITTIAASSTRLYKIQFTNVTPGSYACTVQGVFQAAD